MNFLFTIIPLSILIVLGSLNDPYGFLIGYISMKSLLSKSLFIYLYTVNIYDLCIHKLETICHERLSLACAVA